MYKARLTERQNQTYEFIRSYMRKHRKPPTYQEIGTALGLRSTNGVSKILTALEQKGHLTRERHTPRSLRLVDADDDPFALGGAPLLPVASRTTSDNPGLLRQRSAAHLTVDPHFFQGNGADAEACLIGRAGDDGMNGDGIRKGDYLIIEEMPWEQMRNGDIAAFLVDETLLVRRFFHVNGHHHLCPTDRHYTEDMFVPDDPGCYVAGRVIGLMRKL